MPNPKSGTVVDNVKAGVKAVKAAGRVEFKMDKTANVAIVVGKRSFTPEALTQPPPATIEALGKAKPEIHQRQVHRNPHPQLLHQPPVRIDAKEYGSL